jgi:hypothetical protein
MFDVRNGTDMLGVVVVGCMVGFGCIVGVGMLLRCVYAPYWHAVACKLAIPSVACMLAIPSVACMLTIPSPYADTCDACGREESDRSDTRGREQSRHPNPHAPHEPLEHLEPLKQHAHQDLEPLDKAQVAHAEQDEEAEAAHVEEAEAAHVEEDCHVLHPSQASQASDATKRRTSKKKKKGRVAAAVTPPAPLNAAAVDFVPVLAAVFNAAPLLAPPLLDHT